ncbi:MULTISPECIES: GNAT family N-acetyltransferase [Rhizobium/Agrobacterium group]|uniref:N-acetyltransferase n=2 Tax=Rhizobium/Agrobacterium group TaxID=227290 RepID=A0AA88JTA1_RHIRH|nr:MULTISPECIES: GNAT family protein [Rhizobium/Agrobacterium group]KAA3503045.1 N-acetyltransferase [Rhizobium rhizogenes]MBO0133819.1 GNAT family N-acetyltransferase [Agrobacterium burrii]NTZ89983.1 GNAT family N-acetyltransferase [Agrobacterium tumefaciens]
MLRFLSRHSDTPELRSADYLLRLPRYSDFRQWHVLRSESRQFLQPWEPTWRPDELTEGSYRTRVVRNGQEFSSGTAVSFLLFEKETLLVGGITIGYIRRGAAQSCMIGYWVGERHAARGHMSAALKLVIPYIFNGLQLHRIEAACIPENFKSIRLLENAGFQREGLLREYLKINGQWRDHMMFSLLADQQSSGGTKYDT